VLLVGAVPPDAAGAGTAPVALERIAAAWTRDGAVADLARYGVRSPFALLSLVVAGPEELTAYAAGQLPFDDDRMALEFSAPREIHRPGGASNGATLRALGARGLSLTTVAEAMARAGASDWRDRGAMFARTDAFSRAFDDFARALSLAPDDAAALDGLVRVARLLSRGSDALAIVEALPGSDGPSAERLAAASALSAAAGSADGALTYAREATARHPASPLGWEQLAALHADRADAAALATVSDELTTRFPDRPGTRYFQAVQAFLEDDPARAWSLASEVIAADPSYAAAYDLAGAALTRLDRPDEARRMFERSLSFDAHDSSAYANLGLLALGAGDGPEAQRRFAEALWLDPQAAAAREGLSRALAIGR
jgi:Tfp pilus assembly protein PilF